MAIRKALFKKTAQDIFRNPDDLADTALNHGGNADDIAITVPRIWQAGTYEFGNTSFDDFTYKNGDPTNGPSAGGASLIALGPIAGGAGILMRFYQQYNQNNLKTVRYMLTRLQTLNLEGVEHLNEEEILNVLNYIAKKGKVRSQLRDGDDILTQKKNAALFQQPLWIRFVNRARHTTAAKLFNRAWNFVSAQSYFFWLVWMPFVFAAGLKAANGTFLARIILGISSALGFGLEGYKIRSAAKPRTAEQKRQDTEIEQYAFIKLQHRLFKSMLAKKGAEFVKKPKKEAQVHDDCEVDGSLLIKISNAPKQDTKVPELDEKTINKVKNSDLGKYLLAQNKARTAITVIREMVNTFVITNFILWVFGALTGVLALGAAAAALMAVTNVLNLSSVAVGLGTFFAGVFGINSLAKARTAKDAYEKKVCEKLSEEYRHEGISRLEKFNQLEAEVETRKKAIQQIYDANPALKAYVNYDIKNVNARNNYLFTHLKERPSLGSVAKKVANRIYNFFGGGQTGVFVARSLFLTGCIAASALTATGIGAPFVFIGIAVALAVIVGGLKVAQYQYDRNHEKREHFIDTIDVRIDYLKKKDKELAAVQQILEKKAALGEDTIELDAPRGSTRGLFQRFKDGVINRFRSTHSGKDKVEESQPLIPVRVVSKTQSDVSKPEPVVSVASNPNSFLRQRHLQKDEGTQKPYKAMNPSND